jgi:hypothetical protein
MPSTFSFSTKNGQMIIKPVRLPSSYVTPLSSKFTSKILTISGQSFGNGVYNVSTSGSYDTSDLYQSYNAFNGLKSLQNPGSGEWIAGNSNSDGSRITNISGLGNITGDWLQLRIPYSLVLRSYSLFPWPGNGGGVKTWYIVGSNDGLTWNQLDYQNLTANLNTTDLTYFYVINSVSYSYFRIVVTSYSGYNFCALSQFNIGN